jgi:effector-binding domain-containing protein
VVLKSVPAMPILSLREDVFPPRYAGNLFQETRPAVRDSGYQPHLRGAMTLYALRYLVQEGQRKLEPPIPTEVAYILEHPLEMDIALPDGRRLVESQLPPIELMACVIHVGADQIRHLAHRWLHEWRISNGYSLAGPAREVYLHRSRKNPDMNVTEVQQPLKSL